MVADSEDPSLTVTSCEWLTDMSLVPCSSNGSPHFQAWPATPVGQNAVIAWINGVTPVDDSLACADPPLFLLFINAFYSNNFFLYSVNWRSIRLRKFELIKCWIWWPELFHFYPSPIVVTTIFVRCDKQFLLISNKKNKHDAFKENSTHTKPCEIGLQFTVNVKRRNHRYIVYILAFISICESNGHRSLFYWTVRYCFYILFSVFHRSMNSVSLSNN